MPDISESLQAKSDQLNALDLAGIEMVITINNVTYKPGTEQPVWVHYDGDNGKPWKPSKGMRRILATAWGTTTEQWHGRKVKIFCNPDVTFGGEKVGGIQIKAMSDIDKRGMNFSLALNRKKRVGYTVEMLESKTAEYPAERFEKAFPTMADKLKSGDMTLQQIIAKCQQTGQLTQEQLKRLEEVAPVEIHDDDEVEM